MYSARREVAKGVRREKKNESLAGMGAKRCLSQCWMRRIGENGSGMGTDRR